MRVKHQFHVQCNQTVKFRDLFRYASLNADALITGHYVTRVEGETLMYKAKDYSRDQSYFLFQL